MKAYTSLQIKNELERCKEITGTPTTLRQILRNTKIDRGVFIKYLKSNPDSDLLTGEEEKIFNKKMFIKHKEETFLKNYGNPKYNNRDKLKSSHYKENIREEIQNKANEFNFPVSARFLSNYLPYNYDVIENYVKYFNITNILLGEEAKKFNAIQRGIKLKEFFSNNPEELKNRIEKTQSTKAKKYGNSKYNNREKITQTLLNNISPEFAELYHDREKSINFLTQNIFETREQLCNYFNATLPSIENWIYKNKLESYAPHLSNVSQKELELRNYLLPLGFTIYNSKTILKPFELDIYNPDKKIGIEFNGNYWHSSLHKPKDYHFNKSKMAELKGIRLIHIYEHEWDDERIRPILLSLIKIACGEVNTKIYARKCQIKEITNKEAKAFNDLNHLQGHRNAQVTYGLFYNNELVQLMSFSKTKYNKNLKNANSWEIIRGCPGSNNIVIGGVSKLFKHFLKIHNPNQVFSYCDFNKFDGKGYEAIGMKFIGYTGPDMKWLINNCSQVINRQPSKHKELKEIADAQIWGSGSKKYLYLN